jgi:sugar phosphate permease
MIHVAPLHWKWLFWGPSIVCGIVACFMAVSVKETPEENGYLPVEEYAGGQPSSTAVLRATIITAIFLFLIVGLAYLYHRNIIGTMDLGVILVAAIVLIFIILHILAAMHPPPVAAVQKGKAAAAETTRADIAQALKIIVRNPAVWIVAAAYACTGAVRSPVDQWFPRLMQEVYHLDMKSAQFQFLAFLIPLVASAGSLLSGYISDKLFAGGRAPVAAFLYLIEAAVVAAASFTSTANGAILFFVLISFTCNSTHSILGTAAAMDIGGRKMTGFASGLIDSFQYFGSAIGLWMLGHILDHWGWKLYFPYMIPFGLIGFGLMVAGRQVIARGSQQ